MIEPNSTSTATQIFKYSVPAKTSFTLDLPDGARILSFQVQRGDAQIWALVDPTAQAVTRAFRLIGTGIPIEDAISELTLIGAVQLHGGDLVFHLFEKTRPSHASA